MVVPGRVRLVHRLVGDQHVFTSPDVKGLHVSADTEAEAQRAVVAMIDAIADEFGQPHPAFSFIETAEAA